MPDATVSLVLISRSISRRIRNHPLVSVLAAASVGICADRYLSIHPVTWILLAAVALIAWCGLARRAHWPLASWALVISVTALAGVWHHDRWYLFSPDEIACHATDDSQPVFLRAEALDAPRSSPAAMASPLDSTTRGVRVRLPIRLAAIRQADRWLSVSGYAELIVEGQLLQVTRGDGLQITGTLQRVRAPYNPGAPDFAAMRRSRRELVVVHCRYPDCVAVRYRGSTWRPMRMIVNVREWAIDQLDHHIGPRRAGLAAALLLGARERLDQHQVDQFFASGTLHLLAISGLHLGILASVFWIFLRLDRLPRNGLLLTICILAVLYALLTGARPPVVRAATLIVILSLSRGIGRSARSWNSLAAAAVMTLILSPGGLFDAGTQLSFLAVATIIGWWPVCCVRPPADPLTRLLAQTRPAPIRWAVAFVRRIWQAFSLTGIVWLVSAPLVAYRFHLVAPIGLLLNLILWVPVALALFSGWAVITSAVLFPPLAGIFGVVCDKSLAATELATAAAANLSWGHRFLAGPDLWWVLGFYLFIAATRFPMPPSLGRWAIRLIAVWLIVGVWTSSDFQRLRHQQWPQPLTISFAAVGHGTSILIELPDGRTLLYDAGRQGSARSAVARISALIWAHGINHLDAIILSHADVDHFNAVPQLLDRFSVGAIYVSPAMFQQPAPATRVLRKAIEAHRLPLGLIHESDRLAVGADVDLRILHPPPAISFDNDNANSVVLAIAYRGYRILLPGDLEKTGLEELLAEMPCDYDVVMAPHHGSTRSRPADFVAWSTPEWVIVSGGPERDCGILDRSFVRPSTRLFHTERNGAVHITIDQRGIQVTSHRHR